MKRFLLFFLAGAGMILLTSAVSPVNSNIQVCGMELLTAGDYSYVGDFQFDYLAKSSYWGNTYEKSTELSVYEASDACGLYYAKWGGDYYKLIPCKQDGYNFYIAVGGSKLYTKI